MTGVWSEVLGLAVGNGLWAVLFCCLLFYQIKDSRKREVKYQDTVDKLAEKLNIVREVQAGLVEINEDITEVKSMLISSVAAKRKSSGKSSGKSSSRGGSAVGVGVGGAAVGADVAGGSVAGGAAVGVDASGAVGVGSDGASASIGSVCGCEAVSCGEVKEVACEV